jgi:tRNA threonylcarbamoyladenosine biosynthesis protein TsaB
MALILSLETSTLSCSAALHKDGKLLSSREIHEPYSAAGRLTVLMTEAMEASGARVSDIEAVAVSAGPGSYTGLRIGVATAKGFCYSREIPMIAINSLVLLSSQVRGHAEPNDVLCPMIDARRMEVYTMMLDKDLHQLEPISARIIDTFSYDTWLDSRRVLFFGTGAAKCKNVISHKRAIFIDDVVPLASAMGELAAASFQSRRFEDLSEFEPLYLKDFLIRKPKSAV